MSQPALLANANQFPSQWRPVEYLQATAAAPVAPSYQYQGGPAPAPYFSERPHPHHAYSHYTQYAHQQQQYHHHQQQQNQQLQQQQQEQQQLHHQQRKQRKAAAEVKGVKNEATAKEERRRRNNEACKDSRQRKKIATAEMSAKRDLLEHDKRKLETRKMAMAAEKSMLISQLHLVMQENPALHGTAEFQQLMAQLQAMRQGAD